MNVLVVGSGGREHALVWKIAQSPRVAKIYAIPGNVGITRLAECRGDIAIDEIEKIVEFSKEKNIDLVVIGSELPLTLGLVNELKKVNIKAFGPMQFAAQLEGSKAFAKNIMKKYRIPTASHEIFNDAGRARVYVRQMGVPLVIKADGLAGGKGVFIAKTIEEALEAINEIMDKKVFGKAGERIVIEEFMEGKEASLLVFTDGKTAVPMPIAQDYKRALDGDKGLNTGGMGAYAPCNILSQDLIKEAMQKIVTPIIAGIKDEGTPYQGVLYVGLMLTDKGLKVVEFNVRFGDPETQVILPLLESDLVDIMLACVEGRLVEEKITWKDEKTVAVVLASHGYPEKYETGETIHGLENIDPKDNLVFHAGTSEKDGQIITHGGRVLNILGRGATFLEARDKAYRGAEKIDFKGMIYRHDIAKNI